MKRFYLAGEIGDAVGDHYITWREDVTDFLKGIGMGSINPLTDGVSMKDELAELRKKGDFDAVRKIMNDVILPLDKKLVLESDGIISYVKNYSVGTTREITIANENAMPVFVICPLDMPNNSLIGMSTELFKNFEEFKIYALRNLR
jgi:hypothetical protein